jgi:hypothetical protein
MFGWLKQAMADRAAARAQVATLALEQQAQQEQARRQQALLALVLAAGNRAQLRAVRQEALRLLLEPAPVLLALQGRKAQLVQERLARARTVRSRRSSASRTTTARPTWSASWLKVEEHRAHLERAWAPARRRPRPRPTTSSSCPRRSPKRWAPKAEAAGRESEPFKVHRAPAWPGPEPEAVRLASSPR